MHSLLSTSQLSRQDPLSASFFNVLFINFFKYCTGLNVTSTRSKYHKIHISTGPLIRFKDTALLYINCLSLNLQEFRKMWHFSSFFFFFLQAMLSWSIYHALYCLVFCTAVVSWPSIIISVSSIFLSGSYGLILKLLNFMPFHHYNFNHCKTFTKFSFVPLNK